MLLRKSVREEIRSYKSQWVGLAPQVNQQKKAPCVSHALKPTGVPLCCCRDCCRWNSRAH
jgi:hypothetical protein